MCCHFFFQIWAVFEKKKMPLSSDLEHFIFRFPVKRRESTLNWYSLNYTFLLSPNKNIFYGVNCNLKNKEKNHE